MDSNLCSPYTGQIGDDSVNLRGSQLPDTTLEILAGDLEFFGEDWRSLSWIERQWILEFWQASRPNPSEYVDAGVMSPVTGEGSSIKQQAQQELIDNERNDHPLSDEHENLSEAESRPMPKRQKTSHRQWDTPGTGSQATTPRGTQGTPGIEVPNDTIGQPHPPDVQLEDAYGGWRGATTAHSTPEMSGMPPEIVMGAPEPILQRVDTEPIEVALIQGSKEGYTTPYRDTGQATPPPIGSEQIKPTAASQNVTASAHPLHYGHESNGTMSLTSPHSSFNPGLRSTEDLMESLLSYNFTEGVSSILDDFDPSWSILDPGINRNIENWSNQLDDPEELLRPLHVHAMEDAELHSVGRWPQPRCHPGTRVDIIERIHTWLTDEDREQNMMWLSGPAGVGKTAVTQTIGELAEELGIFGAAIFFSKGRKVDNASLFVTSVASQYAKKDASYKMAIADLIREDPRVLMRSDRWTQLRRILLEPLQSTAQNSLKRLIIVDGLDECRGDVEQLRLVRLIAKAVRDPESPPFMWMICSRPEHHLKELFRSDDVSDLCLQLDLLPQEPGAQADIERYLVDGLERIAHQYSGRYDSDSTFSVIKNSEELSKLVHAASGVFLVASSILAFVGDPVIANPPAQLQIIFNVIDGSSSGDGDNNFLAPIDALYVGVLSGLENDQRQNTLQLVGICAVSPAIPALHLANLLGITQVAFYSALRTLHAFLSVPDHTAAGQDTLHFFHASFPDFLTHHARSKEYFQDPDVHRFRLVEAFFHALNSTSNVYSEGLSWVPLEICQQDEESPIPTPESPLSISYDILGFAATHIWELCTTISLSVTYKGPLLKMLASLDFRRLRVLSDVIPVQPFTDFIRWVYTLGKEMRELTYIVRTYCLFDEDKKMLEKCRSIAQPLNLESVTEIGELEISPRYIFAGFGVETIMILLVPEAVIVYSIEDIDNL